MDYGEYRDCCLLWLIEHSFPNNIQKKVVSGFEWGLIFRGFELLLNVSIYKHGKIVENMFFHLPFPIRGG